MSKLEGFDHEIDFWNKFVKTERFKQNWLTAVPNPECQPETWALVSDAVKDKKTAKILDIGSGVVSILRGITNDKYLTACDPLADEYAKIFDYEQHGIKPVVQGYCEELPFKDSSFDVVHISNALDHTQDPKKCVQEMQRVCKKDGLIVIAGFVNEGEHEGYRGLHQWNIDIKIKGLTCTKPDGRETLLNDISDDTVLTLKKTLPVSGREYFIFAYRNAQ